MLLYTVLELLCVVIVILLLVKPLGLYMYSVYQGKKTILDPILCPIEKLIYRILQVKPYEEQDWKGYTISLLFFSFIGLLLLYLILRLQDFLPLNPQQLPGLSPDLAFNTSNSFVANTNWQAYAGESTLSYLSQMLGLSVQNFVSAASGMSIAIAFIRGLTRKESQTIGNFWFDLTRSVLWILLPICILISFIYVWEGVPQNFKPYTKVTTLEGKIQTIPQGPIASQEAIKSLGTNGGGYFNANSAHPYENPTPLTNMVQIITILLIASAFTNTFGRMANNQKQGNTIFFAMLLMYLIGWVLMYQSEIGGNPNFQNLGINNKSSCLQSGGNMEGKETRFGIGSSILYNQTSTAASDGGVNSTLDSYMPIGGAVAMVNLALGEVIFGGVGAGMYTMLLYALLAVFLAGLMVGRTPEYLGKRIEAKEIKMVALAILISPFCILIFTAIACIFPEGIKAINNQGPHGFSEILYAFDSAAMNNGSAFQGLGANTFFYNITTGMAMLFGRFFLIIPIMRIAGSMALKKNLSVTSGTFPTTGPLFSFLLIGVVIIIVGLSFLPALSLGPIVEQLYLNAKVLF